MNASKSGPPSHEELRLQKLVRSHSRWRLIFLFAAVVLPLVLYGLFERQARRLDALADHGEIATATITSIERQGSNVYARYEYSVDGSSFTWSVKPEEAPYAPGADFLVTYLPEDPSLSRPGADRSRAGIEADKNRSFRRKAMLGAFAFVALNAALLEFKVRKLKKGQTLVISPKWLGRAVALLLLVIVLATNFFADVSEVQRKAFGAAPIGVPVAVLVSLGECVLFIPFFWVFEHVLRIVAQAVGDRASLTKGGLAWYILRAHKLHPELGRSRAIALAGFGYFVVLVGSWIAYAANRGL